MREKRLSSFTTVDDTAVNFLVDFFSRLRNFYSIPNLLSVFDHENVLVFFPKVLLTFTEITLFY